MLLDMYLYDSRNESKHLLQKKLWQSTLIKTKEYHIVKQTTGTWKIIVKINL